MLPLLQSTLKTMLNSLPLTPKMPVLFVGHGSPMNAIEDNAYWQSWQALGETLLASFPTPRLILCISAHWLTRGWWITGMESPRTIHDFGGFPQALFDVRYPAPGAPSLAHEIAAGTQPALSVDAQDWGLDHGAWSVLAPMFPKADIPVVQLSMDYSRPLAEHLAFGTQLAKLREQGVLIVGSGNVVHNLRAMRLGAPGDAAAYPWAAEFDASVASAIESGNHAALANFEALGAAAAALAHPTHEHYLPLLYAAGATQPDEPQRFFNTSFQGGTISMRSVVWG
jgi:4,5-DOPA dioxygenase extradiol